MRDRQTSAHDYWKRLPVTNETLFDFAYPRQNSVVVGYVHQRFRVNASIEWKVEDFLDAGCAMRLANHRMRRRSWIGFVSRPLSTNEKMMLYEPTYVALWAESMKVHIESLISWWRAKLGSSKGQAM